MRIKRLANRTDVIDNTGRGKVIECFSYEDKIARLVFIQTPNNMGWVFKVAQATTLSLASQQHLQAFSNEYAEQIEGASKATL